MPRRVSIIPSRGVFLEARSLTEMVDCLSKYSILLPRIAWVMCLCFVAYQRPMNEALLIAHQSCQPWELGFTLVTVAIYRY